MTELTDQAVYIWYEHRRSGPSPQIIHEDDADTLRECIDWLIMTSRGDSQIVTGEVHVAKPHDKYLEPGDYYLRKHHGVSISHGLVSE